MTLPTSYMITCCDTHSVRYNFELPTYTHTQIHTYTHTHIHTYTHHQNVEPATLQNSQRLTENVKWILQIFYGEISEPPPIHRDLQHEPQSSPSGWRHSQIHQRFPVCPRDHPQHLHHHHQIQASDALCYQPHAFFLSGGRYLPHVVLRIFRVPFQNQPHTVYDAWCPVLFAWAR